MVDDNNKKESEDISHSGRKEYLLESAGHKRGGSLQGRGQLMGQRRRRPKKCMSADCGRRRERMRRRRRGLFRQVSRKILRLEVRMIERVNKGTKMSQRPKVSTLKA